MGRFRNPRYAPEALERKLSPSGFVGHLPAVTAHVTTMNTADETPPTDDPGPVTTPPSSGSGDGPGGPGRYNSTL